MATTLRYLSTLTQEDALRVQQEVEFGESKEEDLEEAAEMLAEKIRRKKRDEMVPTL